MPSLDPKDLLPCSLEVSKGAITIGNASTPNLLVAQFQRAEGTYGIVEARSKHDLYKQVLNIKLQNPSMSYVENENFTSTAAEVGRKTHERVNRADSAPPPSRIVPVLPHLPARMATPQVMELTECLRPDLARISSQRAGPTSSNMGST